MSKNNNSSPSKLFNKKSRMDFNSHMGSLGIERHARRGYAIGFIEHLTGNYPTYFSWKHFYLLKMQFKELFNEYIREKIKNR